MISYQEIPVSVDAVSQASDEDDEVGSGEKEGGDGHKHHPALQQRHGHVGGGYEDPYEATEELGMDTSMHNGNEVVIHQSSSF